eukprot:656086-Pelagomonas_calceolata.AAC.7
MATKTAATTTMTTIKTAAAAAAAASQQSIQERLERLDAEGVCVQGLEEDTGPALDVQAFMGLEVTGVEIWVVPKHHELQIVWMGGYS